MQGKLRKHYFLEEWVYFAAKRSKRPKQFKKDAKNNTIDFFAPGNEHTTPPEIGRIQGEKGWKIRYFENKFPILTHKKYNKTKKGLFTEGAAYGMHEVIVDCPEKDKTIADFTTEETIQLLKVYSERIKKLEKRKYIKYVNIFKNHGREAGASLYHSHTQVAATTLIPPKIKQMFNQPYNKIISKEEKSKRLCYKDKNCVAFAPFASKFNYEIWLFPRRKVKRLDQLNKEEKRSMATMINKICKKLKSINTPYNFFIYYAPKRKDMHLHLQFMPRMGKWAGFELGTGMYVNSVFPEDAAIFYKE